MKRFSIYAMLAVILTVPSCDKSDSRGGQDFMADFEPDGKATQTRVIATTGQEVSDVDADIILCLDQENGSARPANLQDAEVFELDLETTSASVVRVNGINFLAMSLAQTDEGMLLDAISEKGGKWVLFLDGTLSSQIFIDCIEGFMGRDNSYQGPRLYMHTDIYSHISSFAKEGSSTLTFTIKGKKND